MTTEHGLEFEGGLTEEQLSKLKLIAEVDPLAAEHVTAKRTPSQVLMDEQILEIAYQNFMMAWLPSKNFYSPVDYKIEHLLAFARAVIAKVQPAPALSQPLAACSSTVSADLPDDRAKYPRVNAAYKRYPDLALNDVEPEMMAQFLENSVLLNTQYTNSSFVHKMMLQAAHSIRALLGGKAGA